MDQTRSHFRTSNLKYWLELFKTYILFCLHSYIEDSNLANQIDNTHVSRDAGTHHTTYTSTYMHTQVYSYTSHTFTYSKTYTVLSIDGLQSNPNRHRPRGVLSQILSMKWQFKSHTFVKRYEMTVKKWQKCPKRDTCTKNTHKMTTKTKKWPTNCPVMTKYTHKITANSWKLRHKMTTNNVTLSFVVILCASYSQGGLIKEDWGTFYLSVPRGPFPHNLSMVLGTLYIYTHAHL